MTPDGITVIVRARTRSEMEVSESDSLDNSYDIEDPHVRKLNLSLSSINEEAKSTPIDFSDKNSNERSNYTGGLSTPVSTSNFFFGQLGKVWEVEPVVVQVDQTSNFS